MNASSGCTAPAIALGCIYRYGMRGVSSFRLFKLRPHHTFFIGIHHKGAMDAWRKLTFFARVADAAGSLRSKQRHHTTVIRRIPTDQHFNVRRVVQTEARSQSPRPARCTHTLPDRLPLLRIQNYSQEAATKRTTPRSWHSTDLRARARRFECCGRNLQRK